MKKTTVYIEDDIYKRIKSLSFEQPSSSMSKIVNEILRKEFGLEKKRVKRFYYLKKALGTSKSFDGIDPVEFQRKIRAEYDS